MNRNKPQSPLAISDFGKSQGSISSPGKITEVQGHITSARSPVEESRRAQMAYNKQIAFHIAGHAAAMYLNNHERSFPPIFFHIANDGFKENGKAANYRIIHNTFMFSHECRQQPQSSFFFMPNTSPDTSTLTGVDGKRHAQSAVDLESDILNLMAGPLSEARYVHYSDNEPMTRHLLNLDALHHYGGSQDLDFINECLLYLPLTASERKKKLKLLFNQAINFVTDPTHWKLISQLAGRICRSHKNVISYKEIEFVASAIDRNIPDSGE